MAAKAVEEIDGRKFLQLDKNNNGLNRFVTGSVRGLRDFTWLKELRVLRNAAADKLDVSTNGLFDDAPVRAKKRRRSRAAAAAADMSEIINIDVPPFMHDGIEVSGMTMAVKNVTDRRANVSVELLPENLRYVRLAMLNAGPEPGSGNRAKAEHEGIKKVVRWCNTKQAFLAKGRNGKGKTFRPAQGESADDPIAEAFAKAEAFTMESAESYTNHGHDDIADFANIYAPAAADAGSPTIPPAEADAVPPPGEADAVPDAEAKGEPEEEMN